MGTPAAVDEHVAEPPPNATVLARTEVLPAAALAFPGGWYTVQFHPESIMTSPNLQDQVPRDLAIPTLPDVVMRVQGLVNDPNAVQGGWRQLTYHGAAPDIGAHEDVLLLKPKAYLRSTRSRYHLNEASVSSVHDLHVWTIGSGEISLSCHAIAARECEPRTLLPEIQFDRYRIDPGERFVEQDDIGF